MSNPRRAVIIGGGPAGLTAAYELLERTDVVPVVLELENQVGGISKTFVHNGNRIDLGGHRFFSRSDRVMNWWLKILPIRASDLTTVGDAGLDITYHNSSSTVDGPPVTDDPDNCMLIRSRVSRILFRGKFFDYPLSLGVGTILKLGVFNTMIAGFSYIWARLFPVRPESSLEDFIINRFGRYLYGSFFRDYTEKVWGVPCTEIPADWGAQRIKGLSITAVIKHAVKKVIGAVDVSHKQEGTETSLIERFLYPKHGPGHMWEQVADKIEKMGGEVLLNHQVIGLDATGDEVHAITVKNVLTGDISRFEGDIFFSTMPVRELIEGLAPEVPAAVRSVSDKLPYRDFMTVGVLAKRLTLHGGIQASELSEKLPDNWIYVQEPHVKVGRIQVFNNWSPYLVADPDTVWMGMEYFLNEGDDLWCDEDASIAKFAVSEMESLGFLVAEDVLDTVVLRQKKAYPAYFGSYAHFDEVREYVDRIGNLYLLGRNGQHRYNNQDHSMLTAMVAVDLIAAGAQDHDAVWEVNTEEEYHEEK